jgi:hypothetical protein
VSGKSNDEAPAVRSGTPTPTATPKATSRRKHPAAAASRRPVSLKIVPTGTVYVCLEDAKGSVLVDKATLEAGRSTRTFRSRRFRVTFGTNAARMRVNGKSYAVASSRGPVGYEIRAGHRPRRLTSGLATCS